MIGIQKSTVWRTSDGKEHADWRSATLWQMENTLRDYVLLNIPEGMDGPTVADWMIKNSRELSSLLTSIKRGASLPLDGSANQNNGSANSVSHGPIAKRIHSILEQMAVTHQMGLNVGKIHSACPDMNIEQVRSAVKALIISGHVIRVSRGNYLPSPI